MALAISRRSQQFGDSALTDYQATARGFVTFLAQVGPGFPDPPKAVRVDELAVEVYWRAPNLSKQEIIGRRDTLLLPADIAYYSDRYGIVQNNFPDSIRLGEGHDVHDVPHPLSSRGPDDYDYAIADSLRIVVANRAIAVYDVRVRPRVSAAPRVVGDLYLDRATGALVRMSITFTRAAILDKRIETLAVTLDNALVDGRFWLPLHQELEVARTTTWLDYPVRGIIRGRWDICCYRINRGLPYTIFVGPPIAFAPPGTMARYPWSGGILDSLPNDVSLATPGDVRRVEETAHQVVRDAALNRVRAISLSTHSVSDIVRVNRVEGLALGAGVAHGIGSDWSAGLGARYGLSNRQANGEANLTWSPSSDVSLGILAYRQFRDAGDVAESSILANSFAAQEFGADYTDPYDVRGVGIQARFRLPSLLRWRLAVSRETQRALAVHAVPVFNAYEPTIPALAVQATRAVVTVDRSDARGPWRTMWRAHLEARGEWFTPADTVLPHAVTVARGFLGIDGDRPFGDNRVVARASIGGVTADGPIPAQDLVYTGGPTSGPGYAFHAFAGQVGATLRGEWQMRVPAPSIALGSFGSTPRYITLAPFVSANYVNQAAAFRPLPTGWYPAAGLSVFGFFDLLRVEVGHGLRRPGEWTFWIDVNRDWWSVL